MPAHPLEVKVKHEEPVSRDVKVAVARLDKSAGLGAQEKKKLRNVFYRSLERNDARPGTTSTACEKCPPGLAMKIKL